MDIKEIQNLIKFVSKSGVEEVKIEREKFKLTIRTGVKIPPQQIIVEENGFGQYLLNSEIIYSITIDGANRKWLYELLWATFFNTE